jgi:GNAT superfamily N-acetyltransferase
MLLQSLTSLGFHTAYAGITLPNNPSLGFHERLGFSLVGTYREVGYKFGKWQDVGWWQKQLSIADNNATPIGISAHDLTAKSSGKFVLSSDNYRMQENDIHSMLAKTHWGKNRTLSTVEKSIQNSLCFGVFKEGHQIAFARVVTDHCTFAYLCDVVVHENYRGLGLSKWLMDDILAHPELQSLRRFILATRDAHALYTRYGFQNFSEEEQRRFMGLERQDNV